MERILNLYNLPYDADYPVVCFDERPCFLIGDTKVEIPMKRGKVVKQHYAYSKHGACSILGAIEPKTGFRLAHIRARRTKKEFAHFLEQLAQAYPEAQKIRLVLDNLNTHHIGAFYECFPIERAAQLAQLFEFYYTPKSASWLNMMEIEYSALSRQCLNRRIPCIKQLEQQTILYFNERMKNKIQIDWQFDVCTARQKLKRRYLNVNPNLIV